MHGSLLLLLFSMSAGCFLKKGLIEKRILQKYKFEILWFSLWASNPLLDVHLTLYMNTSFFVNFTMDERSTLSKSSKTKTVQLRHHISANFSSKVLTIKSCLVTRVQFVLLSLLPKFSNTSLLVFQYLSAFTLHSQSVQRTLKVLLSLVL